METITDLTLFYAKKIINVLLIIYLQDNWTFVGEDVKQYIFSAHGIGDVNCDGYADIVIGYFDRKARVYFGGKNFDTNPDLVFFRYDGPFGPAGDVNDDGFDDVLIGIVDFSNGNPIQKINLYFGGIEMDTIPDFSFSGTYYSEILGTSLHPAGDVNGDGFTDFIIGSPYNWYDGMGRAYLFFGGPVISSDPGIIFMDHHLGNSFGAGCIGIGDTNKDGFDDIMISAPEENQYEETNGKLVFYLGGSEMDSLADRIIQPDVDISFGLTLKNAGDVNSDGVSDFLVTSLRYAYLYLTLDSVIVINASAWGFGGAIVGGAGGDINNDGLNDILIGNTNYRNNEGIMVGQLRGFYGSETADTLYDFCMEGENKWDEFSKYSEIIGDLNGDGFDEVLVMAPSFPDTKNKLGKVYIYSYTEFTGIRNTMTFNMTEFHMNQNYPNPFNSSTTISYDLPYFSNLSIEIFNSYGQMIKTLFSGLQESGSYAIAWDGTNSDANTVVSGIYFCRITVHPIGRESHYLTKTTKLIMLK